MTNKREQSRTKFYRTIAWIVSLSLHAIIIYYLAVISPSAATATDAPSQVIAKIE